MGLIGLKATGTAASFAKVAGQARRWIGQRRREWQRHRPLAEAFGHFLPRRCLLCETSCGTSPLCPACERFLPGARRPRCLICARPWQTSERCAGCRDAPPAYDATVVAADYAPPLDRAITALKFAGQIGLAQGLGDLLAGALQAERDSPVPTLDRFVPIPLAAPRLAQRGFNQSQLIAASMLRHASMPPARLLHPEILVRQRDTVAQSLLLWSARQANLDHGFVATTDLAGLRIGVVDDVMTTGATLQAAALALKAAGAVKVVNLVVARTA